MAQLRVVLAVQTSAATSARETSRATRPGITGGGFSARAASSLARKKWQWKRTSRSRRSVLTRKTTLRGPTGERGAFKFKFKSKNSTKRRLACVPKLSSSPTLLSLRRNFISRRFSFKPRDEVAFADEFLVRDPCNNSAFTYKFKALKEVALEEAARAATENRDPTETAMEFWAAQVR